MNKRTILFWGVLVLALLACKATGDALPLVEQAQPSANLQLVSAPEPEQAERSAGRRKLVTCRVRTGVNAGVLNLRSCSGVSCSVAGYLHEGEPLTVLERGAWLEVETVTGEQGYVNSKYCKNGE